MNCRLWLMGALVLLVAACPGTGSTTTRRPALDRPVVAPDGTLWDALTAAEANDPGRLRYLLSTRFIHQAVMPDFPRGKTTTFEQYENEERRMLHELEAHQTQVRRLAEGYLGLLRERLADNFVHTEPPVYDIEFRGEYNAARGPNRARVTATFRPRKPPPSGQARPEPTSLVVLFVQEREMWRIDGFEPDPLKGAFTR